MTILLDFQDSRGRAFLRGFSKGLAAPVVLFSEHTAPAVPRLVQILPPQRAGGDPAALAGDWARVGMTFHRVVQEHGQGASQTPGAPTDTGP